MEGSGGAVRFYTVSLAYLSIGSNKPRRQLCMVALRSVYLNRTLYPLSRLGHPQATKAIQTVGPSISCVVPVRFACREHRIRYHIHPDTPYDIVPLSAIEPH